MPSITQSNAAISQRQYATRQLSYLVLFMALLILGLTWFNLPIAVLGVRRPEWWIILAFFYSSILTNFGQDLVYNLFAGRTIAIMRTVGAAILTIPAVLITWYCLEAPWYLEYIFIYSWYPAMNEVMKLHTLIPFLMSADTTVQVFVFRKIARKHSRELSPGMEQLILERDALLDPVDRHIQLLDLKWAMINYFNGATTKSETFRSVKNSYGGK
jgi:hypothetical protein